MDRADFFSTLSSLYRITRWFKKRNKTIRSIIKIVCYIEKKLNQAY